MPRSKKKRHVTLSFDPSSPAYLHLLAEAERRPTSSVGDIGIEIIEQWHALALLDIPTLAERIAGHLAERLPVSQSIPRPVAETSVPSHVTLSEEQTRNNLDAALDAF